MPSVPARALILGLALAAGCKPDPFRPDAAPPWWKPAPGQHADWDIQIAATPFDVSAAREMYMIDLWDAVPAATTIDYGDGMPPLAVPPGAHAQAIAQIHGQAQPGIVVCHVGTGSIRLDDPDVSKFLRTTPNPPPNRPNARPDDSLVGWSTTLADANERFIDIRQASRNTVLPLITKRIELAKTIGCDAIAAANNDLPAYQGTNPEDLGHGFPDISLIEFQTWSDELSNRAHASTISIGPRNKSGLSADRLALSYDWILVERCAEDGLDCPPAAPFLNRNKGVFAIEYDLSEGGQANNAGTLCGDLQRARIDTGIIKSAALDSSVYMRCM